MTEKKLFKITIIVLTLTLVVPVIVLLANNSSTKQIADKVSVFAIKQKPLVGTGEFQPGTVTIGNDVLDGFATDKQIESSNPVQNTEQSSQQPTKDSLQTSQKSAPTKGTETAQNTQPTQLKPESKYVVKQGDTYGCIAEKYYGSYDQWPTVYSANAGYDGYGEYDLAVGASLVLPAIGSTQTLPVTKLCN